MPQSWFKKCKACGDDKVFTYLQYCKCGFQFYKKRKPKGAKVKRPVNQKFVRLRNFIKRSFPNVKFSEEELNRELHVAKVMVVTCYDDYDFIAKYKIPSWVKGQKTLLWFKKKEGKTYLKRKYNEYLFEPEVKEDIIVDEGEIKGENVEYKKRKSLREFLDE